MHETEILIVSSQPFHDLLNITDTIRIASRKLTSARSAGGGPVLALVTLPSAASTTYPGGRSARQS
jgi:hypothetical protein